MTIEQLIELLQTGLRGVLHDVFELSENPDTEIRPEYLKTMSIAKTLKGKVGSQGRIRLEQETSSVLGLSLHPKYRPKGFRDLISRAGEVDIVLSVEENGWQYPVILIENKRYAAGYSTIEKDTIRCAEFVYSQGETGSIEAAVVTYFRRETRGVIQADQIKAGNRALDKIKGEAEALANQFGLRHRHDRVQLKSTAFPTKDAALFEEQDGMPAYLAQLPYTIWGVTELFFREVGISKLEKL
jgi:hypothetical protein